MDESSRAASSDVAVGFQPLSRIRPRVLIEKPEEQAEVAILPRAELQDVLDLPGDHEKIVCRVGVNSQSDLNSFFRLVHTKLRDHGRFVGFAETISQRRRSLSSRFPRILLPLVLLIDFVCNRVLPRLSLTRKLHRRLSPDRRVVLSATELLGRLVYCGFEIEQHHDDDQVLRFSARKAGAPSVAVEPPSGLLFSMERLGLNGQLIRVYKIRTMHPYAQFLQTYISATNGLQDGGKFADDFRVTAWGRVLRRTFLDELPMLFSVVKRDLKLVGVRPISQQYVSLYPDSVRQQRIRHKPGLIPPFYADLPKRFGEIVESEKRYMDAYEVRPLETDVKYLCLALFNVVFRGARSG